MTVEDAEYFCALLRRMPPEEVTRFTEWMAEALRETKAMEATSGE